MAFFPVRQQVGFTPSVGQGGACLSGQGFRKATVENRGGN